MSWASLPVELGLPAIMCGAASHAVCQVSRTSWGHIMGLLDQVKGMSGGPVTSRAALDEAEADSEESRITNLVQSLLNIGLDGRGPFDGAQAVAESALAKESGPEGAINRVARAHLVSGALGGFATGVGGFVTMPVALPINVLEFYVQATRMVGAIASLRGYDVSEQRIRSAILLTLVGSNADEVLTKAGVVTGSSRIASLALKSLPPAALLMINKAIGFRLLRGVGEKAFSRLGRGVPFVGGLVGAVLDGYMMKRIADQAKVEFPQV